MRRLLFWSGSVVPVATDYPAPNLKDDMARTIWKFNIPLNLDGPQRLSLPMGSQFLTLRMDPDSVTGLVALWYEVPDKVAPLQENLFVIVPTGHEVPDEIFRTWVYLGTAFDGSFAWHVYTL
jgi:hypothetical protein